MNITFARSWINQFIALLLILFPIYSDLQARPFSPVPLTPLYTDNELETLWSSLSDIYHPSIEDYQAIQNYLKYGRRPYLDALVDHMIAQGVIHPNPDRSDMFWNRILQKIMLVGPNKESPTFHRLVLGNVPEHDLSRCIILYASFNADTYDGRTPYVDRMWNIVKDLENVGYRGHVLLRSGGYPATEYGGILFAHVPYSFKVLSLIEASLLGYDQVLWLDCSAHPTNNLSEVFTILQQQGTFLLNNNLSLEFDYNFKIIIPDCTLKSAGLTVRELPKIPHIVATIIGVSFKNESAHQFINEWLRLTGMAYPAMTLYPEELLVSIASWRASCRSYPIGKFMSIRSAVPTKPLNSQKPFWFDKS